MASSGIQFGSRRLFSRPGNSFYQRRVETVLLLVLKVLGNAPLLPFSSFLLSSLLLSPLLFLSVSLFPSFPFTFLDLFFVHPSPSLHRLHYFPSFSKPTFRPRRTTNNDRIMLQDGVQVYQVDCLIISNRLDSPGASPSGSTIPVDAPLGPYVSHIFLSLLVQIWCPR